MKLSLHIEGTRVKPSEYGPYSSRPTETAPYDIARIDGAQLEARTLANTLRAIAEGLDPQVTS